MPTVTRRSVRLSRVRFPYRPRPTPARWPAPRAVLLIVAMSLGMWLAITFPVWGQPSAWHLTSDVLDPRAISVIITIDGIVVPDCGPGIAACIDNCIRRLRRTGACAPP